VDSAVYAATALHKMESFVYLRCWGNTRKGKETPKERDDYYKREEKERE
jgi:hypothetical protein